MTDPSTPAALVQRLQAERYLADMDPDYEPLDTRPTWRGWIHFAAFFTAIAQTAVLIPLAAVQSGRAALGVSIYCVAMLAMFGTSALYHRRRWSTRGWRIMKRLDHCMIFLFIAGTYAPFGFMALDGATRWWVLGVVWGGCAAGIALKLFWPLAPRWVGVPIYIAVGWAAVFVLGPLLRNGGLTALVLLIVGGVCYTLGAICYATRWPNPRPGHFGYHEVFHAFTVLAALSHYIAVFLVLYSSPLL
ncbi:hemolysin III family protein [Blastococcus sp. Marseille-P5729]|uniref:PAQR family membrane homeostasis protein TrhA n=1 Tax=Blastococcus sp. Marseille-P5729 TaxID=2086582 RepID=UPI001F47F6A3|nr:hemolysin III family protein [Blastococcus sp. Marseille-P5729]